MGAGLAQSVQAMGLTTEALGFDSPGVRNTSLLHSFQTGFGPLMHLVLGALSGRQICPDMKLNSQLYIVPRLRMCGAMPPRFYDIINEEQRQCYV